MTSFQRKRYLLVGQVNRFSPLIHGTFELWRQDDNGIRFLVGIFGERATAEERLVVLARCQHKQTYWITESVDTE